MSKLKEYKTALIALLSIIVLLSIYIVFFDTIVQNNININDNNTVILSKNAYEKLQMIYPENLDVEIPSCLAGIIHEDQIMIQDVAQTEIKESTTINATYVQCPNYINEFTTIATLHNHPNGNCNPSGTDLKTYGTQRYRGQIYFAIKCDEGYVFFTLQQTTAEVDDV